MNSGKFSNLKYLKKYVANEIDYLHLRNDFREEFLCDLYRDLKETEENLKHIKKLYGIKLKYETRDYMMSLRNEEIKVTEKHIEEVKEIISFIEPKIAELEKNGRIDILSKYQGNGE